MKKTLLFLTGASLALPAEAQAQHPQPVATAQSNWTWVDTRPFFVKPVLTVLTWQQPLLESETEQFTTYQNSVALRLEINSTAKLRLLPAHVRVLVNNQPVAVGAKLADSDLSLVPNASGTSYQFRTGIEVPEGDARVEVVVSPPGAEPVRSKPLRVSYLPKNKPNLYLFAVGVSTNLRYTTADAKALLEKFKSQREGLFKDVEAEEITGEDRTKALSIKEELEAFSNRTFKENDVVVVYFSSHGSKVTFEGKQRTDDFAIHGSNYSPAKPTTSVLGFQRDVSPLLARINCKKIILMDACHSGLARLADGERGEQSQALAEAQKLLNDIPPGTVLITSSQGNETSFEDDSWQHGAFTRALLDALDGAADQAPYGNGNRIISVNELYNYLETKVPQLVKTKKNKDQHPRLIRNIEHDVPLFQIR